ncbi:hypothetical protein I8J29_16250 [Paenibacillus sp. MWE-103]|uniref:Uncharacterized protein n=1 Tax=Paenibacillus artemisiicola TaxID=1172618 RepID=A0ABS3WBR7_9BACL|nr:hypothetical protein [Paenibacillus artemisiicola]MBO7745762.1 hypothetical protein [Paenibacillus artemisiicola]
MKHTDWDVRLADKLRDAAFVFMGSSSLTICDNHTGHRSGAADQHPAALTGRWIRWQHALGLTHVQHELDVIPDGVASKQTFFNTLIVIANWCRFLGNGQMAG